jgi:diguanylate cyclase (GGDEF)-like protein
VFPPLVTLGLCLITTIVFAGGPWGYAFACFYIWSGTHAWYFLSGRQAAVQTALAIIAIICVWVTGRATGLYLLMVIGTLLTVCLWLRNAVRGVRHQALTDGLTGVPNRRGWDQALMVAVDRGRRAGATLCVAMLDLDHFKVFNDEHGHQTGDLLLQSAVRGWRSGLRSSDTIARYGGEEFAILLDGFALASAAQASEARVIAEGIEDERTIGVLRDLHVELRQGFHLGRSARLNGRRSDDATEAERCQPRSAAGPRARSPPFERPPFPLVEDRVHGVRRQAVDAFDERVDFALGEHAGQSAAGRREACRVVRERTQMRTERFRDHRAAECDQGGALPWIGEKGERVINRAEIEVASDHQM